ncbi:MAG: cytochrome P450 [Acidimicrobiia bacterium]
MSAVARDVNDAARRFDHWQPEAAVDPYPTLRLLRDECPVAHSDRHGGFWIFTRYDDVSAALRDHETYSSTIIALPKQKPGTILPTPPLDQDPPAHTRYRQMLLPFFTPQRTAALEPVARRTARDLAAALDGTGGCEAMSAYCFPMPTVVLGAILGVPAGDQPMFLDWTVKIVEHGGTDPKGAQQANQEIYAYLRDLLAARRHDPRDDILTFLLHADLDGTPLTDDERLGIATLLLIAGIDTTANTLATALWYLALDRGSQRRIREHPGLLTTAIEEFLRVFSAVSIARITTRDVTVGGCPIARGEQVLMSLPAANRDERKFTDAETVVLDRDPNPHLGFGLGVHRCLGSHIARMELRVGLEEFFAAIPDFRLADPATVTWKSGPIRGPKWFDLAF